MTLTFDLKEHSVIIYKIKTKQHMWLFINSDSKTIRLSFGQQSKIIEMNFYSQNPSAATNLVKVKPSIY